MKIKDFTTGVQHIGIPTIYLFHPIFTMAAKFYHPLFSWDSRSISF